MTIPIERVRASAWRIPTDAAEADASGTWDTTTLVLVEAEAEGRTGLGWSYTDAGAARLVMDVLRPRVEGEDAMGVSRSWRTMVRAIRRLGVAGVAASAVAAVDVALWDLKARLLGVPLATLLGPMRKRVPVYGSGGFTSYDERRLREQLGEWVGGGMRAVKMKVGADPGRDLARVRVAREAIGDAALFVDADGAWTRKQALACAESYAEHRVSWIEEPVSPLDLEGMRIVRDRAPAGMDIAAGEEGVDLAWYLRLRRVVDVVQADATRCLGITGFLKVASVCEAAGLPLSALGAPAIHVHAGCAAFPLVHVEWFHDHARVERMLFEGMPLPADGQLAPDLSRPGLGLELRRADARPYAV